MAKWTQGEVDALSVLLAQGVSTTQMAGTLCRSRSSVSSKLTRMGKKTSTEAATAELDEGAIQQLREEDRRLIKAKADLKLAKQKRQQAEEELELAHKTIAVYESTTGLKAKKIPRVHASKGQATAIFCATDWHIEACVEKETVNDRNQFDLEIAEQRINYFWNRSLHLLEAERQLSEIKDAVLWIGGDIINGNIHDDLSETNTLGPADAIIWVQPRLAAGIELLASRVDNLTVITSIGNHSRTTEKMRTSTAAAHSLEWPMYNNLASGCKAKNVTFVNRRSYESWLEIQGLKVRFHHGNLISGGQGVAGITGPVARAIMKRNRAERADLDILGHFHTFIWNPEFVMSGSLVGYDAYANSIATSVDPPSQAFVVIDRERGVVVAKPIFCDPRS